MWGPQWVPPPPHRPGLVRLGAHTQLHTMVPGRAGAQLHPQKCMWGCVTWGDSSCASRYILPFKNNCDLEPRGDPQHPCPRPGGVSWRWECSGLVTVATAAAVIALQRVCHVGRRLLPGRDVVSYCRIDLGSHEGLRTWGLHPATWSRVGDARKSMWPLLSLLCWLGLRAPGAVSTQLG